MSLIDSIPSNTTAGAGSQRSYRCLWALLALLVIVTLAYWPGMHGGFVFDDFPNIVDNAKLRVTTQSSWSEWVAAVYSSPASSIQRPLAMLTFSVNHALTGIDPFWMKLTNLGIHLLNTVLAFALGRRLLGVAVSPQTAGDAVRNDWIALWIAAAWALNPINLMGVLFVVQRMESLSHTFVFGGLWLYLSGRTQLLRTGNGWTPLLAGLIGGTALGVLVKESAVLLPVYALMLEGTLLFFASRKHVRDGRLLAIFALTLALPGVIGLIWLLPKVLHAGAYAGRDFTLGQRLLTESRVLVDYLHWTLLPDLSQLSLYHDDYQVSRSLLSPPSTGFALLLLAALIGSIAWLRKRRPLMALGLAWFFSAHALTATVTPLELVFEHRNYFASFGLCIALADLCLLAPRTRALRRAGVALTASLLLLYTGVTVLRATEWRDPVRFALSEAAKHPQSPRATYDVARNFIILSNYRSDSPYVDRAFLALDAAMRAPNATPLPETAAIILASRTGRRVEQAWWISLHHKLRAQPIGPQSTSALGKLVDCQMKHFCQLPPRQMLLSFLAALNRGPNAEVLSIYGNYALNVLQDPTLALQLWQEAARVAPREVEYQATLAKMLIATGQFDQASAHIANVRAMGKLGQNASIAAELERLSEQARHERLPSDRTN